MPDVQILGQSVPPSRLALFGGGALILFLVLRSRSAPVESPGPTGPGFDPEFLRIVAESRGEIEKLEAANRIEGKRLDNELVMFREGNPASQRQCIPWPQWNALSKRERDRLTAQAKNGKVLLQPTLTGLCFTPTSSGSRGHEPYSTETNSRGFFDSSSSYRGPAGSGRAQTPGDPGFIAFLRQAFDAYTSSERGY